MNLYGWIDVGGVFLLLWVMTLTEHDVINRVAPWWLQWTRRGSFGLMIFLLCNAVKLDNSRESLLPLVWSGMLAIAVNVIAISMRQPPKENGKQYPAPVAKAREQSRRRSF